jgi:lipopolysaccharide biosynthesis glycosyltransferase
MLAVLIASIEQNYAGKSSIDLYIVDDGISNQSRQRLYDTLKTKVLSLHFVPMADAIPDGVRLPVVPNSYPLNTYLRLLIPYFLPAEVTKALFLDVDMLVLGNIAELWQTDIEGYAIGAVADTITKRIGNIEAGGIANFEALGLDGDAPYFNAGMQLINIPVWREQDLTKRILQCIHDNARYAVLGDQYGLNVVLAGNWLPLNPLWNYMANGDHGTPQLIHFIHRKPFYRSYFNNPSYQRVFYDYLGRTAWKGTAPIGESARYFKKIGNVLQKARQLFS